MQSGSLDSSYNKEDGMDYQWRDNGVLMIEQFCKPFDYTDCLFDPVGSTISPD
jgi:hypothetical protein